MTNLDDFDTTKALEVALDAACTAGRILMERRGKPREVRFKGQRDIVTDADFAANQAIRSLLEQAFPSHLILSEEDAAPGRAGEFLWMVDPLDGTTNFAHDYPIFSVSVGLTRHGRAELGVVYDPVRDECFHGTRGGGAFLNGRPIQVSATARIEDAIIGYELSRLTPLRESGLDWFATLAAKGITGRIGGSAALSFCYVGAGRLDAYMHLSLQPWDIAAGMVIAREGGARVTDLRGGAPTLRGGGYLLANRHLFRILLHEISELKRKGDGR